MNEKPKNPNESSARLSNEELNDLFNDQVSDHDLVGSIKIVKMLLGDEALPFLLHILKNNLRPYELRKSAAEAIRNIGAESEVEPLSKLQSADDPKLSELATLALSWVKNPKS